MLIEWFADILVQSNVSYNKEYMPLISSLEELNAKMDHSGLPQMLFDPYPFNGMVSRRFCKGADRSDIDNAAEAWETFETCYKNPEDNNQSLLLFKEQMRNISKQKRQILLECFANHFAISAMWKKHESLYTAFNKLSQPPKSLLKTKLTKQGWKVVMKA